MNIRFINNNYRLGSWCIKYCILYCPTIPSFSIFNLVNNCVCFGAVCSASKFFKTEANRKSSAQSFWSGWVVYQPRKSIWLITQRSISNLDQDQKLGVKNLDLRLNLLFCSSPLGRPYIRNLKNILKRTQQQYNMAAYYEPAIAILSTYSPIGVNNYYNSTVSMLYALLSPATAFRVNK